MKFSWRFSWSKRKRSMWRAMCVKYFAVQKEQDDTVCKKGFCDQKRVFVVFATSKSSWCLLHIRAIRKHAFRIIYLTCTYWYALVTLVCGNDISCRLHTRILHGSFCASLISLVDFFRQNFSYDRIIEMAQIILVWVVRNKTANDSIWVE